MLEVKAAVYQYQSKMPENREIDQDYAELEPEVEEVSDKPDARPVSSQPHDWTI